MLVQGSGRFLKASHDGSIQLEQFDLSSGNVRGVTYGKGDTIVWGAGKEDLRVLTRSDRPFTDDMEVAVEIGSTDLPLEFWKKYQEMILRTSRPSRCT